MSLCRLPELELKLTFSSNGNISFLSDFTPIQSQRLPLNRRYSTQEEPFLFLHVSAKLFFSNWLNSQMLSRKRSSLRRQEVQSEKFSIIRLWTWPKVEFKLWTLAWAQIEVEVEREILITLARWKSRIGKSELENCANFIRQSLKSNLSKGFRHSQNRREGKSWPRQQRIEPLTWKARFKSLPRPLQPSVLSSSMKSRLDWGRP